MEKGWRLLVTEGCGITAKSIGDSHWRMSEPGKGVCSLHQAEIRRRWSPPYRDFEWSGLTVGKDFFFNDKKIN